MDIMYSLGIDEKNLKFIIEQCPNVLDISNEEIESKIKILEYIGCSERQIKNIIISNPNYLDRINNDILDLINRLTGLGFNTINLLFDSNPFLLNKDVFEIDEYINIRINAGELLEDIVDSIESNPYIIDEI